MLYLVLLYIFISGLCFTTGVIFYRLFKIPERPLVVYALTGLILLSGLGQWLVLFVPLSKAVFLTVASLVVGAGFYFRSSILRSLQQLKAVAGIKTLVWLSGLGALLFMIVVLNAGPTMMDDTESYHIQMIKWAQEYGTVPGIANLHLRYGFNSSWFISIGLLSPAFRGINTYVVLNGVVSCWACIYFLEKWLFFFRQAPGPLFQRQGLSLLLLLAACLFCWPMIRGNATTSNYDFITTLCVVILFLETVFAERSAFTIEWLIWPCYLFTVRIINFPLLLLAVAAIWLLISQKKWRNLVLYGSAGVLLVIPFLARNVVLSGYPLFPSTAFDWFPVDWKADRQMMVNIVDYIQYFNRVNAMHQSIATTKALGSSGWIVSWYHFLFRADKLLVTVSLLCYVFCLCRWKYLRRQFNDQLLVFFVVLAIQLVCWFFIAPDPRFVYGALLCGIFLACMAMPAFSLFSRKVMATAFVMVSFLCFVYAAVKLYRSPSYQNYALPFPLPQPPVKTITIDDIELRIPEKILDNWNARCYGTDLPCLYRLHPALRARGKDVSDGFYLDSTVHAIFDNDAWY